MLLDRTMTLEQLAIFVAVAERGHLTRGAEAIGLSPSAASSAIRALESVHNVRLFDRVGRSIVLTRDGEVLLAEARLVLAQARAAEAALSDLGGLRTGTLAVMASQTVGNYWLPARLLAFEASYPGIEVGFSIGNTEEVAKAVVAGSMDIGIVEGEVSSPLLRATRLAGDRLVAVTGAKAARPVGAMRWIMRENGSGTRAAFERALHDAGHEPRALDVALVLPSNESVLSAVLGSDCAAALSELVVAPFLRSGDLRRLDFDLPPRPFFLLRHRERRPSAAAREFEAICKASA